MRRGTHAAGLCLASLLVGVGELPVAQVLSDPQALQLLMISRLPRTLAALLMGSGLAMAGVIMQAPARRVYRSRRRCGVHCLTFTRMINVIT
ncbi:MAG TPA: iron chelate uptake ABC transporter family permease subunit [Pseudorhizobium sp.]|nr:iron chelate uptake ABC transporter family permease subunit [Pseudorhizobium sp.]